MLTVEGLTCTGNGGQTDGAKATFSQPTSCCTEAGTVYVTDLATGTLKTITRPSRLLKHLQNLNKFLRGFGVHGRNEPRANVKTFSAKEATDVVGQVKGFFQHCISEVRKITNLTRILQGTDGVCSQQTIQDLEVTYCITVGPNDLKIGHLGQVCTLCTFSYQTLHTDMSRCLDHFMSEKMSWNVILLRHIWWRHKNVVLTLGSLSTRVSETRTATGREHFTY